MSKTGVIWSKYSLLENSLTISKFFFNSGSDERTRRESLQSYSHLLERSGLFDFDPDNICRSTVN